MKLSEIKTSTKISSKFVFADTNETSLWIYIFANWPKIHEIKLIHAKTNLAKINPLKVYIIPLILLLTWLIFYLLIDKVSASL